MALIDLNDALPAAPSGKTNIKWQADPPGDPPREVSAYMPLLVGDGVGSPPTVGGVSGAVPAPAAGDAAAGKFLKADGTWAVPPVPADTDTSVIGCTFFATGTDAIQIPFGCTITGWAIMADVSGSASVDICFHAGSAPPSAPSIPNTTTDKISASAPVALSSAQSAAGGSSAISTWTTALSQWGSVLFNLTSLTTATRVRVELYVTRT